MHKQFYTQNWLCICAIIINTQAFIICTARQTPWGWHTERDGGRGGRGMRQVCKRREMHTKIWWRNLGDKTLKKPRRSCKNNIKKNLKRIKDEWLWTLSQNMGRLFYSVTNFNNANLQFDRVDVDPALLGNKAASLRNQFPVYRRTTVPSSSRTLNLYHPVTRCHISVEGTPQPHCCKELKTGEVDI